jgi:trehalose 6-phosphate synthase/phosphatase
LTTLGLQSALSSFHQTWDTVWVGWPGVVDSKNEAEVKEALAKSKCVPVFMPEDLVRRYYDGFSNNTIWPLLHSFPGSAHYSEDEWEGINARLFSFSSM